jgi:hypothetical protein
MRQSGLVCSNGTEETTNTIKNVFFCLFFDRQVRRQVDRQVKLPSLQYITLYAACMFRGPHAPDPTPSSYEIVSGLGSGAYLGIHASGEGKDVASWQ